MVEYFMVFGIEFSHSKIIVNWGNKVFQLKMVYKIVRCNGFLLMKQMNHSLELFKRKNRNNISLFNI